MTAILNLHCDSAVVQLNPDRDLEVVLLHSEAVDPQDRLIPVGLIVDGGGLSVYPDAARRVIFSTRVLRMIGGAIDEWMSRVPKA